MFLVAPTYGCAPKARFPVARRWPDLVADLGRPSLRIAMSDHLLGVEPLGVSAIGVGLREARAASTTQAAPIMLDVGANVGAYATIAAALGARVLAVEMQPGCMPAIECHLAANNVSATILNRYVTSLAEAAPIAVPLHGCGVMTSPTAVVGRWPHGMPQKATRRFEAQSDAERANTSRQVAPIDLGSDPAVRDVLGAGNGRTDGRGRIMLKIDTEGFEIRVLQSLRPLWSELGLVMLELQPAAWRFSNISLDVGVGTLRELLASNGYAVVTLPHAQPNEPGPARIDLCALWRGREASEAPQSAILRDLNPAAQRNRGGLNSSRLHDGAALLAFASAMHRHPGRYGWFHEVLLVPRATLERCSAAARLPAHQPPPLRLQERKRTAHRIH